MEGKGGSLNKQLEFRSWHCGRQGGGSLNKELDFRSWHCGRQGRGKFIKSQILDQSFKIKSWILDHGIVEGKGGKCK